MLGFQCFMLGNANNKWPQLSARQSLRHRHRVFRKCAQQRFVFGNQNGRERARNRNEFAVVSGAVTRHRQFDYFVCIRRKTMATDECGGGADRLGTIFSANEFFAKIEQQSIAKFATPKRRCRPLAVVLKQSLTSIRVWPGQIQIRQNIGINDDHDWPELF